MPNIEINKTKIYYERKGTGPVCLTFHGGLGMDHTHIKLETERLRDQFEFIYFDLRGNGRSSHDDATTFTYEQLIDDAEKLRNELDLGKVYVYGKSLGCYLALLYATKYQENIIGMIVSCGMSHFKYSWDETIQAGRERNPELAKYEDENGREIVSNEDFTNSFRIGFYKYVYEMSPSLNEFLDKLLSETIPNYPALARDVELRQTSDITNKLNSVFTNTLVIAGRYDIVPLQNLIDIHENLPNSELLIFEKSGHFPSQEEPELFDKTIQKWMEN